MAAALDSKFIVRSNKANEYEKENENEKNEEDKKPQILAIKGPTIRATNH